MRETNEYRHRMEICLTNAAKAPFDELRAVWHSLGNSFAFLAEVDAWPGFGPHNTDGGRQPEPAHQIKRPADDRIRP